MRNLNIQAMSRQQSREDRATQLMNTERRVSQKYQIAIASRGDEDGNSSLILRDIGQISIMGIKGLHRRCLRFLIC